MSKRNLSGTAQETAYTTLVRPKLQYACSAWDPHYQKDKAALERVQRKAARFFTGNYDRATLLMGIYTWNSAEKKHKAVRYVQDVLWFPRIWWEMEGLFDRERRARGSHDFKFIVPKGHKDIFRFFFFPRTITERNKFPKETAKSQTLSIFKSKLF